MPVLRVVAFGLLLATGLLVDAVINVAEGPPDPPPDVVASVTGTPVAPQHPPKIVFGLGPAAQSAMDYQLNRDAPLGMYTTWYNKPEDLEWMNGWRDSVIPAIYASGRAAHLVIWSDVPEGGTPCGRPYPISDRINGDMAQLASIWAGGATDPPLYVTLFTEFQTFPCVDNRWSGAEDYYTVLQRKMLEIEDIFHRNAPNSKVSIGWGGWQMRYDKPELSEGQSLLRHFDAVMRQMDFQSFQAMHDDGNIDDIADMTRALGRYGPVMVAHYKPEHEKVSTYIDDISTILTGDYLAARVADGLFAFSFMDTAQMTDYPTIYDTVRDAITLYGRRPETPESSPLPALPP